MEDRPTAELSRPCEGAVDVFEWSGALGRGLWHSGGADSGYTGRAEEGDTYGAPGML